MATQEECAFCNISTNFPPSPSPSSNHELVSPSAFVVLSSSLCMAFLDIMPLSPGHLLVTTRQHHEKISDVTQEEARELGSWLPILSRVLAQVSGVWDYNIVQNNGAAAAQVVPHVHFHIILRPALTQESTMFGRGQRSEIDDDEAAELAEKLRKAVEKEIVRSSTLLCVTSLDMEHQLRLAEITHVNRLNELGVEVLSQAKVY